MTLTIVAAVAFFAHVVLWIRLPAGGAMETAQTPASDMVLETAAG